MIIFLQKTFLKFELAMKLVERILLEVHLLVKAIRPPSWHLESESGISANWQRSPTTSALAGEAASRSRTGRLAIG